MAVRASGPAMEIILAWTTLAIRSLLDETAAVLSALDRENFDLARRRLSAIVGRDTEFLSQTEILPR
jgi:adenosylcobinamide-phosphate synthase